MTNEIQFLLYNMPDADGRVQVVIKMKHFGVRKRLWHNSLELGFLL